MTAKTEAKLWLVVEAFDTDRYRVLDGALDEQGAIRKAVGYVDNGHHGVAVHTGLVGDQVWPVVVSV